MIGKHFRPWGELEWLLPKLPKVKWDLITCLSTEDRFDATISILLKNGVLNQSILFKIADPPSQETSIIEDKLQINKAKIEVLPGFSFEIEDHRLLEPYSKIIESLNAFLSKGSKNIIVDISTFPKRFFFPIVKVLMEKKIENLLIVYSTPEKYCSHELSANPHSWEHLPLFAATNYPEPSIDLAIVGVGFMPFGLPNLLLSKYNATQVKFLFPFPPGPPNYQRTWDFMRKIQKSFTFKPSDNIIRIDSNNMPDAFAYIMSETNDGSKHAVFAPYGPKPISLAICIYAAIKGESVYYTQPTYYNPEYSSGYKETFSYPIILNGKNLYLG